MFVIDHAAIPYTDPWCASVEQRLAQLYSGRHRVAYFYVYPNNSTFRYRVYNVLECLNSGDNEFSGAYFTATEMETLYGALRDIDTLVLCRAHYDARVSELIHRARSLGVRILFDVDDFVFDPDYVHLVVDTLDQNTDSVDTWVRWFSEIARHGAVLRMCDAAITTNEYLSDRIKAYANVPVEIIPNFMNSPQLEISESIYARKSERNFERDSRIHLGYFSGSPSHNKDFDLAASAICALMAADSRIVLRVVGFLDIKGRMQEFQSRIEYFPLTDFMNLERLVGEVEINLIPLQDNMFTNCKSELKYFESAIVGTVSVASGTFTLKNAIKDGENGFLARSWEWSAQLQAVIDALDTGQYAEIAGRAFHHARAVYGPEVYRQQIQSVLFGSAKMPSSGGEPRRPDLRTIPS